LATRVVFVLETVTSFCCCGWKIESNLSPAQICGEKLIGPVRTNKSPPPALWAGTA
jgi:hypothetical protein